MVNAIMFTINYSESGGHCNLDLCNVIYASLLVIFLSMSFYSNLDSYRVRDCNLKNVEKSWVVLQNKK